MYKWDVRDTILDEALYHVARRIQAFNLLNDPNARKPTLDDLWQSLDDDMRMNVELYFECRPKDMQKYSPTKCLEWETRGRVNVG